MGLSARKYGRRTLTDGQKSLSAFAEGRSAIIVKLFGKEIGIRLGKFHVGLG
jgi:hypothetical protein